MRKLVAAVLYASSALATANWLDIGLWPEQPWGSRFTLTLMRVALAGSALFGLASLIALFRLQYAVLLALGGACVSWLYFAPFAVSLPWTEEWALGIYLNTNPERSAQVAAILFLSLASLHLSIEAWRLWRCHK